MMSSPYMKKPRIPAWGVSLVYSTRGKTVGNTISLFMGAGTGLKSAQVQPSRTYPCVELVPSDERLEESDV